MTPPQLPPLSPTEWRLMSCIWHLQAASPPQVSDFLRSTFSEDLSPKSAGILLSRLEEKGFLRSVPAPALAGRGRPPHIYEAVVTREQSLLRQLKKFLDDHLIDADIHHLLRTLLSRDK